MVFFKKKGGVRAYEIFKLRASLRTSMLLPPANGIKKVLRKSSFTGMNFIYLLHLIFQLTEGYLREVKEKALVKWIEAVGDGFRMADRN